MADKIKVGDVFTYFQRIGVAGLKLTDVLKVGDRISIEGSTTNIQQTVDSMQAENSSLKEASAGQEVGVKVPGKVRPHDVVYRIVE